MAHGPGAPRRGLVVISALVPAFLVAGVVLGAIPVGLHLIARRPPERKPLPTVRFLSEDARTFIRLRRRLSDVPLLLIRVLFALALGCAFAGLTWTGERSGEGRVVLLDAGADSLLDWDAAVRSAADLASTTTTDVVIVAYGLDDGPRLVAPGEVVSLERGSVHATFADGLEALRAIVLTDTRFASVAVTWLTRPSWRSWTVDVGLLRPVIWPGRVDMDAVPDVDREPVPPKTPVAIRAASVSIRATSPSARDAEAPLARAAVALGYTLVTGPLTPTAFPVVDRFLVESVTVGELRELAQRAREGATVVVFGAIESAAPEIPWESDAPVAAAAMEGARGGVVVAPGVRIGTDAPAGRGRPRPGSHLVAVFADATPAASATRLGDGCMVYSAVSLTDHRLTERADYPVLVDALLRGCEGATPPDGPLDAGAVQTLVRSDLPLNVDVPSLAAPEGTPLTVWLALLATLLLAVEVVLTRRGRP